MKKRPTKKDREAKIFCDIRRCLACRACEIHCGIEHSKTKDIHSSFKGARVPKKRVRVSQAPGKAMSMHCQHCKDAACVAACMSSALYKDKKTGATIHDKDKCVGCWMCVMACPFGALVRDVEEHIAVKCDLCPDRDGFACVDGCPTGALFYGTPEEFKKRLKP